MQSANIDAASVVGSRVLSLALDGVELCSSKGLVLQIALAADRKFLACFHKQLRKLARYK
jgi:hypothetical protein